jgi:hypothetical protein
VSLAFSLRLHLTTSFVRCTLPFLLFSIFLFPITRDMKSFRISHFPLITNFSTNHFNRRPFFKDLSINDVILCFLYMLFACTFFSIFNFVYVH